jgi:mannose-6-phosphate isomerase
VTIICASSKGWSVALENFEILSPFIVRKIWGGQRLAQLKSLNETGQDLPIGETWEVSRLAEGPSGLGNSDLHSEVSEEELPYLIKFIDTSDNLSVQVHPHDEYARQVENSVGKTECWLILDAEPGAGIYLGFKPGITKEEFETAVAKCEDVSRYLVFHQVQRGDFFFVPAGSIHAIGKGVTLIEVQQSSGITYRVWDWNRVDSEGKSRELHVDKAMDVSRFESDFNDASTFNIQKGLLSSTGTRHVISHPDFNVWIVSGEWDPGKIQTTERLISIISLDGEVEVDGIRMQPYQAMLGKKLPDVLKTNKSLLIVT